MTRGHGGRDRWQVLLAEDPRLTVRDVALIDERKRSGRPVQPMKVGVVSAIALGDIDSDGAFARDGGGEVLVATAHAQGLVTIDLAVKAELKLLCQRSLVPFTEAVDRRSRLVVIEDVAEQDVLPEAYDPVLVEDRRLALADLVEEELLLAVPQVPISPEAGELELPEDVTVETSSGKDRERTHRPFEGLAGLLKESAGD